MSYLDKLAALKAAKSDKTDKTPVSDKSDETYTNDNATDDDATNHIGFGSVTSGFSSEKNENKGFVSFVTDQQDTNDVVIVLPEGKK